jgi:hypothetical protein
MNTSALAEEIQIDKHRLQAYSNSVYLIVPPIYRTLTLITSEQKPTERFLLSYNMLYGAGFELLSVKSKVNENGFHTKWPTALDRNHIASHAYLRLLANRHYGSAIIAFLSTSDSKPVSQDQSVLI